MAFQKAILPDCPQCNQPGLRVIESRRTGLSTRRRKKCDCCHYRITTHEVTADFFEEAKRNLYLVEQLYKLMNNQPLTSDGDDSTPSVSATKFKALNKCGDCHHNKDGCYCAFDFPEYDTAESYDCNHFQLFKSK